MKTNNSLASKQWERVVVPCAILLSLLSPSLVGGEPRHGAAKIHVDDSQDHADGQSPEIEKPSIAASGEELPRSKPASIVRPSRTQRVATSDGASERASDKATHPSALNPTWTDEQVRPAQFVTDSPSAETVEEVPAAAESPSKLLEAAESMPASGHAPLKLAKKKERSSTGATKSRPSPEQSLRTIGGSLAVVIALVLGMALLFRKTQPKGAGALPLEVIEVLGRSTLTKGQNLQLVRIGGKLVLLCVTAHGSETLTEITDSEEVERLATLCRQSGPKSVSAAFRDVLAQIGSDAVTGGFVGAPEDSGSKSARPTSWWQQQYS